MPPPSVTIIVRTIGHPRLPRALASLAAQTHANLATLVVVADPAFALPPALVTERVTVLPTTVRLPRPLAANRGLDHARGDYIGFLDEDDWLAPAHVATLVAALESDRGYALAYGDTVIASEPPTTMSRGYWKQRFQDFPVFTIHGALFASRLVAAGCRFDPGFDLVEDWDFWLQCAELTDFLHVPVATAYYDPVTGTSGTGQAENRDPSRSERGKARLAAKWLARYRALEDASREALQRAATLIAANDFAGARSVALTALQADPGNPLLLNRLALALVRLGDRAAALAALRRACDVDRGAFDLWLQRAWLEHVCGERDAAMKSLDCARSLATDEASTARVASVAAGIAGT
jgi:hypothetical protein